MSHLTDGEILQALALGEIQIDPPPSQECIQPASIDLHLGGEFLVPRRTPVVLDLADPTKPEFSPRSGALVLAPGEFALGATKERVVIGAGFAATVDGKSTIGRYGLAIHITAGFIDPGFPGKSHSANIEAGRITLEMCNHAPYPIRLSEGVKICQLRVERLGREPLRPYGSEGLHSHYAGQAGVTEGHGEKTSEPFRA